MVAANTANILMPVSAVSTAVSSLSVKQIPGLSCPLEQRLHVTENDS